jgi:hypothetical protein
MIQVIPIVHQAVPVLLTPHQTAVDLEVTAAAVLEGIVAVEAAAVINKLF